MKYVEWHMGLVDKIPKDIIKVWTPRPSILLCPQIPKPMHGVAPRVVLGEAWWETTRQAAYASTGYHCLACGVHKSQAKDHPWLEAHELYKINYVKGLMTYVETVPLCNWCHAYIHQGRLQALCDKKEITKKKFNEILAHGNRILKAAKMKPPKPYSGPFRRWEEWRLVVDVVPYPPKYKSEYEWRLEFDN